MATVGNNDKEKYSRVRDAFFTKGEIEQFGKVLKNPAEQEIHDRLKDADAKALYKKATALIARVEKGEFTEEQMEKVEYAIAHYLAGIDDIHLENILIHELTPKDSKEL